MILRWLQRKKFSISFTKQQKKFCICLRYNGTNSYIFVNGVKTHKFKTKVSKTNAAPLCFGNASNDFSVDNMQKNGLYWYVYNFLIDYESIYADDILDIHK